ncbi:armadillo-type protein [Dipodascopsis tothii]|uniref:armadillo-type protein n=1 Tax=Dipodascopsis tothii TaxID=44089 RepID=UPI0034CEB198
MSSIPPEVTSELVRLIEGLSSPDNAIRAAAENNLNTEWAKNLDMLLVGLAEQCVVSESVVGRAFSAVLFRRMAMKQPEDSDSLSSKVIDNCAPETQAKVRQLLLQALLGEQTTDVRHKICDSIAMIAIGPNNERWPELLEILFQLSKSNDAGQREAAFRIFTAAPEIIGKPHIQAVAQIFSAGFHDPDEGVRIAAMIAFAAFFDTLTKSGRSVLQPLLPDMLNVLPGLNTPEKADELTKALTPLIELAAIAPKIFKPMLKTVVDFCVAVMKNKDMSESSRQGALELLTTFADEAPNMCKKEPAYVNEMVVQCLAIMTEVGLEDDEQASEWRAEDDLDTDEAESIHVAARQSLDRLAVKLGGVVLLPPLFQWLPNLISSGQWRERHAALMAISAFAEGCREPMIGELSKVLDMVLPLLQDPHPRVQWAACNAVGQMSTDFADDLQRDFGSRVLPALIQVLQSPEPRVQAHAAAALVNFSEEAEKETLEPYLDSVLTHLLTLLQSPKRYVQEQTLTTIAIVADAAENKFVKYYDTMMPLLLNVLQSDTGSDHRTLKAKCIECSSLIALAVGKDKFAPLSQQLIHTYAAIQTSATDDDDPSVSYLMQAWGRICRTLGTDFLPYLGGVITPLIHMGKTKPELQLIEDQKDIENFDQDDGWDVIPIHGKHLGVRTAMLEDKCTAIELMAVYAAELGAAFEPYVQEIMVEVVVPCLRFFFHDGVRVAAAQAIPHLLNCVKEAKGVDSADFREYWTSSVDKVLQVLKLEPLVELLTVYYTSFYQSVELANPGALSEANLSEFSDTIVSNMTDYIERVKARVEDEDNEAYVEEAKDEEAMIDDEFLSEMNKAVHVVFKASRAGIPAIFEKILPVVSALAARPEIESREFALCVFDDCVEFAGPESWKYKDIVLPALGNALMDPSPTLRQAAAYGFGVAGQHGGPAYAQAAASVVPTLLQIAQIPDARSDENVHATENASAAIAKICRLNGSQVANVDNVIEAWVHTLPIINDQEAAPFAYLFLVELVEQGHPAVAKNVPAIFDSVTKALEYGSVQGQTAERVVAATKQMLAQLPHDQVMGLFNALPGERQAAIRVYFQ